ncbi:MAG: hypothetical protein QME64_07520 [bacterium]|nr:hypothetical protein [bacterium]
MISEKDKSIILSYAKQYHATKVILFGSAKDKSESKDIDLGIRGIAPALFFEFCWQVYRDASKPVDIIDLETDSLFTRLIEKDGLVLYG